MFNVICCWLSLSKSRTVSDRVTGDGKRRVFIDQRVHLSPSIFEHAHMNKGAQGQVYLKKGKPGRVFLNKGVPGQIYPNKVSPGRLQTNRNTSFQKQNEKESRGESSRGRSICKCGVAKRLRGEEIRARKRLLRKMMVDRCPLL